ncbi:polysaccharide pyruvyl transferase CsaB [Evansella vedderi]|uniref:Polysaccharide pyruvyl transferase CsaB n=1 Tax=Evansella vedderi TaxID=38282 RepID=A0ABT9ZVM4_9BACI|nr:polysaccharide pyruvyl transferase CsaB [Evansella vedderi]MDQ0254513.1 polysaccharide pyruvyl transferase CsaB [Evansella vedderi]
MEIVISGYYGFDNVGDEAILLSIIQGLKKDFPSISITVLSNQPKKTAALYKVKAVNRWKLKEVIQAIKTADGVISGGGGLLQDKTGSTTVLYYCGIMWLAHLLKKPFFVYAQGIGPIQRKWNQKITAWTLGKASLLTVRDENSKNYLKSFGVKKEIAVVPDPVVGMRVEDKTPCRWMKTIPNEKPYLTATVRYWLDHKNYLTHIAKGLSLYAEQGFPVVLIPMHGEDDLHCSQEVKQMMTKEAQGNTYIAPHEISIQEKINIIAHSELLVGMRLHSLIFAAINKVPFLSISYDPKVESFSSLCGQQVIGRVDSNSWSWESLMKEIDEYMVRKPLLKSKLVSYTEEAVKKADYTCISVLKHLVQAKVKYKLQ